MTKILAKIGGFLLIILYIADVHASVPRVSDCTEDHPPGSICPGSDPGTSTTNQRVLTDSVTAITSSISEAIILALRPRSISGGSAYGHYPDTYRTTGYPAGDTFANWSGWASYVRTQTDNTKFFTEFDSSLDSGLAGFDASPKENMIIGLAVGYENNDIETIFNAGEQRIHGFTIAPYFGYLIHPNVSVDASAGYSSLDIDQNRIDEDDFTSIINSDTDSDRWFVSGNVNAFTRVNEFALSARIGIIYAEDDIDALVETGGPSAFTEESLTVELGQIQVGGEIAYSVAPLEPYASLFYEHDFVYEKLFLDPGLGRADNDRSDIRLGLGARYFSDYGFSANLEWNIIAGRQAFDSHTLNIIGRLDF